MLHIQLRSAEIISKSSLAKVVMGNYGKNLTSLLSYHEWRPVVSEVALSRTALSEANRIRTFHDYLDAAAEDSAVSEETAQQARDAWRRLSRETEGRLPVPDAATGPGGELLLTWDRGTRHLELEFLPDGVAEFFFRHRATGAIWGETYRPDAPLSAEAQERIRTLL